MSARKAGSTEGAEKDEPEKGLVRLSPKPAPAKVETKPKNVAGKDTSSDKKVQTKGEKGSKEENRLKWPETKDLPVETEKLKTEESPASDEAGE